MADVKPCLKSEGEMLPFVSEKRKRFEGVTEAGAEGKRRGMKMFARAG